MLHGFSGPVYIFFSLWSMPDAALKNAEREVLLFLFLHSRHGGSSLRLTGTGRIRKCTDRIGRLSLIRKQRSPFLLGIFLSRRAKYYLCLFLHAGNSRSTSIIDWEGKACIVRICRDG